MTINKEALAEAVGALAQRPGIRGCALVEVDSGMVWTAQGELADNASLWEAASDHWRLHSRHAAHFDCLGGFIAVALYHADGLVALFRCAADPELLFIAVGQHRAVDWPTLQRMGMRVGELAVGQH
ncbi:hypothetical protein [Roseateles sp.]|uniref:hypothetical protein n=1 Tax=Roseateles sp. TaxID=1971397 RepID=UPI0032652073